MYMSLLLDAIREVSTKAESVEGSKAFWRKALVKDGWRHYKNTTGSRKMG